MFTSPSRKHAVSALLALALGVAWIVPSAAAAAARAEEPRPAVGTLEQVWSWLGSLPGWWHGRLAGKSATDAVTEAAASTCEPRPQAGVGDSSGSVTDPDGCA